MAVFQVMVGSEMKKCPCDSGLFYPDCCGQYIHGALIASSPEVLMRSRYTAYTIANVAYIKNTMCGIAATDFNAKEVRRWARRVHWTGLQVVNAYFESENIGFVEFIASFNEGHVERVMHEKSEFHRIEGIWFYVDGVTL